MGSTVKPQFTVTDDDEDQKPNPPAPGGFTVGDDDDATATPPSDQDLSNFQPAMREKVKSGVVKMQPPTKFEEGKQIKENYGFTPGNMLSNAYEGAKGTLGAVAGAGYDALLGEGKDEQGEEHHGLGGLIGLDYKGNYNPTARDLMLAHKYVIDPASSELGKAKEEAGQGHYLGAIGHVGAAALPVLGPVASQIGEQAGTGDIGGAASQVAGGIAAGEALPHVGKVADVADKVVRGTPLTDAGKLEAAKNQAMVVKKPSMNETEYSNKVTAALPDLQKAAQDNAGKVKTPRDAVGAINGRIAQIEAPISDHLAQLGDVPENQVPTDLVNHSVMSAVDAELAKKPGMFTPEEILKAKTTVQKFLGDQPTKSLTELENNRKRFNQESQDYYSSKPADKRAMDASEATAVAQRAAGDAIRDLNYGPDDGSSPGLLEKAGVTAQDAQGNAVPIRAVRKQVGNLIDVRNHFEDAITRAEASGDHSIFKSMRSGPSLAAGGLGLTAGLVAGGPFGAILGTLAGEGAKAWGDYLKSKNPNLNVEKMFRNLEKVDAEPNVSSVKTANPVHQYPQPIGPQNVQFATPQGPNLPPEPFAMHATAKPNASQLWEQQVGELPNVGFPDRAPQAPAAPTELPARISPPTVPDKFRRELIGQPGAELRSVGATDANRLGAEGLGGIRVPEGSRMLPAPQEAPPVASGGTLGNIVKKPSRGVLKRIGEEEEPKAPSRQAERLRDASADITDYHEDEAAPEPTFVPGKTAKAVANVPEAVKRAIGDTGLEYVGTDKLGINHLHDPETGNTLAVLDKDLDPVKVKARLEAKRAQVEAAKETQKKTK